MISLPTEGGTRACWEAHPTNISDWDSGTDIVC
jgi:hypothetical protein